MNAGIGKSYVCTNKSKIDTKDIAFRLHEDGHRSNSIHIEDLITEALIESINPELVRLTDEVIAEMQELEHPEPRNREEYNERYGLDKE